MNKLAVALSFAIAASALTPAGAANLASSNNGAVAVVGHQAVCPKGTKRTHVCVKRAPSTSPTGKPPYLTPGKCLKWAWKCEPPPPPIK